MTHRSRRGDSRSPRAAKLTRRFNNNNNVVPTTPPSGPNNNSGPQQQHAPYIHGATAPISLPDYRAIKAPQPTIVDNPSPNAPPKWQQTEPTPQHLLPASHYPEDSLRLAAAVLEELGVINRQTYLHTYPADWIVETGAEIRAAIAAGHRVDNPAGLLIYHLRKRASEHNKR